MTHPPSRDANRQAPQLSWRQFLGKNGTPCYKFSLVRIRARPSREWGEEMENDPGRYRPRIRERKFLFESTVTH
jgi:hypothetical protein